MKQHVTLLWRNKYSDNYEEEWRTEFIKLPSLEAPREDLMNITIDAISAQSLTFHVQIEETQVWGEKKNKSFFLVNPRVVIKKKQNSILVLFEYLD